MPNDSTHARQSKERRSFTGLPRTVILLGWVSLLTDVASEMAYPLIPLFLTALGAPALALGLIEGVAESVVSVMKGLSGWHSDRVRKRVPYVQWGYGLGAGAKLILAVALGWPMVLLGRTVDRFGKGLRTTARDALIADLVPREQGGKAYGFHRAMDTAGALIGVLISAGLIALLPGQYRLVFGLALLPGVCAIALTFRLREGQGHEASTVAQTQDSSSGTERLSAQYWRICTLQVVFALANSSDTFLLLRAHGLGLSDATVILAYAFYNATYTLVSYPAGALSDRIGRWGIMRAGWLLYALVYLGFAYTGAKGLWGLFLLYGVYMGATQGVGKAMIADVAPASRRGVAMGMFHMLSGFATLASSVLAGWLWDAYGPAAAFKFGSGAALVALAISFVPWPTRHLSRS